MTTLVVVGGGPTGLETAGAPYELNNHVLKRDFESDQDMKARVVLVEQLPYLLGADPEKLRQAALEQLTSIGVDVILENPVIAIADDHIQ